MTKNFKKKFHEKNINQTVLLILSSSIVKKDLKIVYKQFKLWKDKNEWFEALDFYWECSNEFSWKTIDFFLIGAMYSNFYMSISLHNRAGKKNKK